MMSNSSSTFPSSSSSSSFSSSGAPSSLQGATFQSRAVPPMPASMASMSSMSMSSAASNPGFISTTGLTSTGLPLTGERAGISQHGYIAPLHGADAMMAPASGGITLPAPIILGTHTTASQQHMHAAPTMHHTGATMASQAPLATAAPLHHQPIAAPMPMSTTTTQTNIIQQQPIMATTTTATTGYTTGLDRRGLDSHGLEARGTDRIKDREYGAEHRHDHLAGADMATTDKKLLKEREKEQHRLAKEQEKLAKERQHEQKQHEKDAKKHEKEMLKEQEHAAKEQEKLAKKHHKEELKAAKHHGSDMHTTSTTTTAFPTKTDTMGYTAQPGMMHGATPLPGSSTTTGALPVATGAPLGAVMASQGDYGRNAMLGEGHLAAVDLAKQQQLAGGIAAQPTGLQQPVGSINMADPPRHVF